MNAYRSIPRRWGAVACLLVAGAFARADDAMVAPAPGLAPVPAAGDRVLIRLATGADVSMAEIDEVAGIQPLLGGSLAIARLTPGITVDQALVVLRGRPGIVAADPDYVIRAAVTPNDTLWDKQCALRTIRCQAAWTVQQGRADVTIAIIDSGVAYDHPDLAPNLARNAGDPPDGLDNDGNGLIDDFRGWDFVDGDNDPHADRGDGRGHPHGTHVAGIACAATDNQLGIAGVAWDCTFLPVRALDDRGVGYLSDLARAMQYATDQGVAVINLSIEGPYSPAFQPAVDYAYERGVVVCAAAGNSAREITTDPASWVTPICNDGDAPGRQNRVIGVAAANCSNEKRPSSNYGSAFSFIDIAAPGANVRSTYWPGASYQRLSGTSQATPHVAGAAALVIAQHGRIGPDAVTRVLKSTAADIHPSNPGFVGKLGAGRLTVAAALGADGPGPITADGLTVDDAVAEVNGRADPGEDVRVSIALRNAGLATAEGVTCRVTSGDARVVVTRASAAYGDIAPGQIGDPRQAFELSVDASIPEGFRVPLTLDITATNGGPWQETRLTLPVGWGALGEPDGTCEDAFPAALGARYAREIGGPSDQDWFAFDATRGVTYNVATRPRLGSSPNTFLSIRDTSCGRELASDDNGGLKKAARVYWTCPADGRYAAVVTPARGWTGPYEFRVREFGAGEFGPVTATVARADDDAIPPSMGNGNGRVEPGETGELLIALTNEGPLTVTGVSASVSAMKTGIRLPTSSADFPNIEPGQTVWSIAPYVLEVGRNVSSDIQPRLTFNVVTSEGAWDSRLRIPTGWGSRGEPDDSCGDALLIVPDGFAHERAFEEKRDVDWFRFDATGGMRYRIRTEALGSQPIAHTRLRLHAPDCGPPIAFDENHVAGPFSQIEWECPASGRYSFEIDPQPGTDLGEYILTLVPLINNGPAEPDNWCEQAAPGQTDGSMHERDFGVPGDEDWIDFAATVGVTHTIETHAAPGWAVPAEKQDPDGRPQTPDTVVQLFDGDCGGEIGVDDDGGDGTFSRITFTPDETGVYSIRVTEHANRIGPYRVSIRTSHGPRLTFLTEPGYDADPVEPDGGTAGMTRFGFRVLYSHADGVPARRVRVQLRPRATGGEATVSFNLKAESASPAAGIIYSGSRKLPEADYECRVIADDGALDATGPATAWQPVPTVAADGGTALIASVTALTAGNGMTEIRLNAAGHGSATVRVLNIAGREVRRLARDMPVTRGLNTLVWDGRSSNGTIAPPGTYVLDVSLASDDGSIDRRVIPLHR